MFGITEKVSNNEYGINKHAIRFAHSYLFKGCYKNLIEKQALFIQCIGL